MALLHSANTWPEAGRAECGICYETYKSTSGRHLPKLLWCYHSLCLDCLRKLVNQNNTFSFVVCPFCRMVTIVPKEGLHTLKTDEVLLQEVTSRGGGGGGGEVGPEPREEDGTNQDPPSALNRSLGASVVDVEVNYQTGSPIFTISSLIPAAYPANLHTRIGLCGWFNVQEAPNTLLVELPPRTSSRDFVTPSSVENLRLVFAVTIILLIISVFFALVFFK